MQATVTDTLFFLLGIGFLALAKAKHVVSGYSTPKPAAFDSVDRSIEYDIAVADRLQEHLHRYFNASVRNKRILELGPGSDLGVGLILVSKGATSYVGFDKHDLASAVPMRFYESIRQRLTVDTEALRDGRVRYLVRDDFEIAQAIPPGIDIVVSNAAFEHFDDVERAVAGLSRVVAAGAVAVIEIDLQTHSRWIRDADPNNIYRYPRWLYSLFSFPGQPNRLRPSEYRQIFERHGWSDVRLFPMNTLEPNLRGRSTHADFAGKDMDWLSFVLCASKN